MEKTFHKKLILMEELRPGSAVHMVFELTDSDRVMKTTVYDIVGKKIILAQTSPPLLRAHLGEQVRISFIVKKKGIKDMRLAFSAVVEDFIPKYEISSCQTVPAVVLYQITDLEETKRRMFYRIAPPLKNDLAVMQGNKMMKVIDISLGGAKLSCPAAHILKPDEKIQLTFIFTGKFFTIDARVVRVEQKTDPVTYRKTQVVSIQYETSDREFGRILAMKIMTMERERLAEGKY
jgi:hypothetical protein